MSWAHLTGDPLGELVDAELPAYDLVRNAHAQGAVVQWNHPSEGSGKWAELGFSQGLGPLGVEAWEHVPAAYEQWRKTGRLPVLVGSTDMHLGYFTDLERSIILKFENDVQRLDYHVCRLQQVEIEEKAVIRFSR